MLRYSGTSSTINQPILFVNSVYKITYRELNEEVQWSKWVLKILFSPKKKKKTLLLIITIQGVSCQIRYKKTMAFCF